MNKTSEWVSKEELHRSIAWAYKWLRRFDNEGLEGLENKPRSGRPPDVLYENLLSKIRRSELSENILQDGKPEKLWI
ncbi:MAG TPA: helix-turn-helix domain-containing protein [Nitrososphaeraceae archaeon]|nr:helix-turn-helix domain-containing protein [Nitrososphaeraceae archaeon]